MLRCGVLFVVCGLLPCFSWASVPNHPAFFIHSWIGDTHYWHRNGNQPWWVEEVIGGAWYETWYEEKLDLENRRVYLHDWNRQLRAEISEDRVVIRSTVSSDQSQHRGRWGINTFLMRVEEGKITQLNSQAGPWVLIERSGEQTPLTYIPSESTNTAVIFRSSDTTYRVTLNQLESKPHEAATFSRPIFGAWKEESIDEEPPRLHIQPDEIINPGRPIAMLTLNTPNIHNWAVYGEANQKHYALKHGYTLYIYRDSLLPRSIVTWNKVIAVPKHLNDHEYLMWIDSDAIITDMDKKIEDIIALAPTKNFLACGDIGGWMLNTGVLIFKRGPWALGLMKELWGMEHLGHDQAAEQNQLIRLLNTKDRGQTEWQLFEQCTFNCHPRRHRPGHYIMHMMGDSGPNRIKTFTEWNLKLGVDMGDLDVGLS